MMQRRDTLKDLGRYFAERSFTGRGYRIPAERRAPTAFTAWKSVGPFTIKYFGRRREPRGPFSSAMITVYDHTGRKLEKTIGGGINREDIEHEVNRLGGLLEDMVAADVLYLPSEFTRQSTPEEIVVLARRGAIIAESPGEVERVVRESGLEEALRRADILLGKTPEERKEITREPFRPQVTRSSRPIIRERRQTEAEARLPRNFVQMGSTVTVLDQRNRERRFTIVEPQHVNPSKNEISALSPIGAALVGKRIGDTVTVNTPAGILILRIKDSVLR